MKTKKTLKNLWSVSRMLGLVRHQLSFWGTVVFAAWLVFAPVVVWASIQVTPNPFAPAGHPADYHSHNMASNESIRIWDNPAPGGNNFGDVWATNSDPRQWGTGPADPFFSWNSGRSFEVDNGATGTLYMGNSFTGGGSNTVRVGENSSLSIIATPPPGSYATFWLNSSSTLQLLGSGSSNRATLSLTNVGRMVLQHSTFTNRDGTLNLGNGNLYLYQSTLTATGSASSSPANINSTGEVVFSGGGGSSVGIGTTGFHYFTVSGYTGGSAALRFTNITGFDAVTGSPNLTRNNRTIILATGGTNYISNPNIYLDGTYGYDASWLQSRNLIPTARYNDNMVYNIVHVAGEGTELIINSAVTIARINPELLNDWRPAGTTLRPGSTTSDTAASVNNPLNIAGYRGNNEYKPWWDPTNNPASALYQTVLGVYNPKYDPNAAIHNNGLQSRFSDPNYNSKFDRSSSDYNPASNTLHIAYNPYVDVTGYSGGWTKVDAGILYLNGAMNRDINSLIDVQGGTLQFNGQLNLGMGAGASQFNPNGTPILSNGQVDKTNYYTIQLNALSNPTLGQTPTQANRQATVLWTDRGSRMPVVGGGIPVDINNRIILHGGGTIRVGDGSSWVRDNVGRVEDDDDYRNYSDDSRRLQGGGFGPSNGYLRLSVAGGATRNGATLVGIRPNADVSPFLNKTGSGVLDMTGVTWEYEQGLTAIEINVFNGTLAFTDLEDLGAGVISLSGRSAKLAVLTNSLMDPIHGQITTASADASRDIRIVNNVIRLVGGGTINVVQGGKELASQNTPVMYENPFFTEPNNARTRQNDGYTNQQNLILNMGRVIVAGGGDLRKIGLGKLTLENTLINPEGTLGLEIQRGTVSFSNPNSLGTSNSTIRFTLDKNATLQYRGTDSEVTVNNNILMTYEPLYYNSGGATFDIRYANYDPNNPATHVATTMKLTGTITGNRNFLTLTKLGDLKSTLDMTGATIVSVDENDPSNAAGAANWDVRTGTLAFNVQSNIGTGNITLSEATTLHKVYDQPTHSANVTLANNVTFRNNGTLIIDDGVTLTLNEQIVNGLSTGGQLSIGRQLDKLGGGTLILNGSIAKPGEKDDIVLGVININGGLRIKEGSLSFSRSDQLVYKETGKPAVGVSINLYGDETSLIYTGDGTTDFDQATQKPRPTAIINNINLLPSLAALPAVGGNVIAPRAGIIDVTNVTGNLQIDGANIRGGNFTLNDLMRDDEGFAIIGTSGANTNLWQTGAWWVTGKSTLVKKGLGTLTLTGDLNADAGENIFLVVEQGKIAFANEAKLLPLVGNYNNLGANKVILYGTGAGLEYVGAINNFTINNIIELHNGGGRLSVLDANAVWELKPDQITADRINADGTNHSGTWTLAKEGAGTLDLTDMDFTKPLVVDSLNSADKLARLEIDNGTVRFDEAKNLGSATIAMGAPKLLTTGQTSYTSGVLQYTGTGEEITNTISLRGGAVLSTTGQPVYDTITKRAVIAGGSVSVDAAAGVLTLKGAISGVGSFVKMGTGTLELSGVNTFKGDLIVESGQLKIAAQQAINGDLIVKRGAIATATKANVLAGKAVYLASGAIFDMSAANANQTLAGIFKYAVAGGGKTQVWVSTPTGFNPDGTPYNCNTPHDAANPVTPTSLDGNRLTLVQTASTRSVIDVLYGNKGASLVVDRGYLTADLDHFHGDRQTLNGGTIINVGKTGSGTQGNVEVKDFGSEDVGSWSSENVKLTLGSHITVGHNPALPGNKSWESANVAVYDASTIDIAKSWLTSVNLRTAVEPTNVLIDGGSRISVGEDWVQSGNVVIDSSTLYVGGQWTHDEIVAEMISSRPRPIIDPTGNVIGYDIVNSATGALIIDPNTRQPILVSRESGSGRYYITDPITGTRIFISIDPDDPDIYTPTAVYGVDRIETRDGMWDPTLNNGIGGYDYDEGNSYNNLTWHMGYGDFDAQDNVTGAANPYSTVTIRNGGVAKVGGNWTSGAVILDNGTLEVGHTTPADPLALAANTGNFNTLGERVWIKNSNVTILGDWASGDVLIEGDSRVSVGMWNGSRPIGMGNMDIVGDFEIRGTPNSNFRTAGNVNANSFTVTNSQSTRIGGELTVFEDIFVTGSNLRVDGNVAAQNLVLSTTTATIGGDVKVNDITLFTSSNVTASGNFTTDSLWISNTTQTARFLKNVTVNDTAQIYGGTVSTTGDWVSGSNVTLNGTAFSVTGGYFDASNNTVTATGSTVTVGKDWDSGITSLTNTATSVTGDFSSGPLTITGVTASQLTDNLFVGGSLDTTAHLALGQTGQVVINSVSGGIPTSVRVRGNWTSDNVYTNGSNTNVVVDGNWTSRAIDTKGGSFKIGTDLGGGDMDTLGTSVKSTNTTWDVKGNWDSGNVTMKNGYADIGGDFKAGDINLTDVNRMMVDGDWESGVVTSKFSITDRQSDFLIGGNWSSGKFTADGGGSVGQFSVGKVDPVTGAFTGNATFTGDVSTTAMNWNIFGDVNTKDGDVAYSVGIRAANYINAQNWNSGATSITNLSSVTVGEDWSSDSLRLDASDMTMTIGGNFSPGSTLSLGMQQGILLSSLTSIPVYDFSVTGNADLGGTLLSVTGAQNLVANGRYYIASIRTTAGTINTSGFDASNLSLFKKVDWSIDAANKQLDVYVDSKGFASYAARIAEPEFGMGKLSHNQLQVVNSLARIENNITAFEIAAAQGTNRSVNAVTISPMRNNAVVKDILNKLVAHGDDETIAAPIRVANINRALTQLSAETYANSMFLAAPRPWMSALDRTRLDNSMYFTGGQYAGDYRGQAGSLAKMNRVWITPEYSFDSLGSDGNARAANIGRLGFSMGLDRRVRHNATAGVLFGFNSARLSQDEDRFQAGDFQIGAYASAMVGYYIELRGFMGCGWQNYESNRIVDMRFTPGGTREAAAGRANGQSFSGTLEAARPLFFGMFILKPTVAMDFSSYARDAFTETGDTVRVNVGRTAYTRVAPRIGATWETDPMKRLAVTTRFFGGYNFGDDHVVTRTQFATIGDTRSVHSTTIGRGFIDAGLGARYHANEARTMSFHGNLDIMAAQRSFSGAVSIGAAWMY